MQFFTYLITKTFHKVRFFKLYQFSFNKKIPVPAAIMQKLRTAFKHDF